eukprot:2011334-Rhodomonas_salina.2
MSAPDPTWYQPTDLELNRHGIEVLHQTVAQASVERKAGTEFDLADSRRWITQLLQAKSMFALPSSLRVVHDDADQVALDVQRSQQQQLAAEKVASCSGNAKAARENKCGGTTVSRHGCPAPGLLRNPGTNCLTKYRTPCTAKQLRGSTMSGTLHTALSILTWAGLGGPGAADVQAERNAPRAFPQSRSACPARSTARSPNPGTIGTGNGLDFARSLPTRLLRDARY